MTGCQWPGKERILEADRACRVGRRGWAAVECMYAGHRERRGERGEGALRKPHGGLGNPLGSSRFSPKAIPKMVPWRSDLFRLLTPPPWTRCQEKKVDKGIVELRLNQGEGLFWETAKKTRSRNGEGTDSLRRARQQHGSCKGRIGFQVGRVKQRYPVLCRDQTK